ncbi:hypothetical protein AMAG_05402 [Allomyces macrogynus ATCC 38327]|uniref:NFACT RNA-binding domain-containing protein n=1 Tax=Allomyces macrogynus (strain ATCC 38327) TaxID=578462 RepID=A0A0L0SC11_ALLM3|nr:hypothetical protein AMAG_05402 [Allomyces macrogynus ATCC 38327]|eukprot:KNE59957.1 hypothetical protein AMAG_05402 [Allomyces macrogynus ATCC 38327]
MGRDKFENEDLIKHAWEEDIWFHVDKLSSAHVYLCLQPCRVVAAPAAAAGAKPTTPPTTKSRKPGTKPAPAPAVATPALTDNHVYCTTWDGIPEVLLQEIAQLTKANSIEGNKRDNQTIIYTPASNLKKTSAWTRLVKRVYVATRTNEIINRLNKSKQERTPDLAREKIEHEKALRAAAKEIEKAKHAEEERMRQEWKRQQEQSSYGSLFDESEMTTNHDLLNEDGEYDFM